MVSKHQKLFSREEADALLPELEQRLRSIQRKKEIYSRMHDTLFMHELVCAAERSGGFPDPQDDLEKGIHALEEAIEELAKDVEAIFATGAVLRSIERGHVDLCGELDGKEVYFSWQLGEPRVRFYRLRREPSHERRALPDAEVTKKKRT